MSFAAFLAQVSCINRGDECSLGINGMIRAGENISGIEVFSLADDERQDKCPINDAIVRVTFNDTTIILNATPGEEGKYEAMPPCRVRSQTLYELSVSWRGIDMTAGALVPAPPRLQSVPAIVLRVYDNPYTYPGNVILSWHKETAYNMITVESREEYPEKIIFQNQELIDRVVKNWFATPIADSFALVNAWKIKYFGKSVIKIWSLNDDFVSMLMMKDLGLNPGMTISPVRNGFGYFTGSSCDSAEVWVTR